MEQFGELAPVVQILDAPVPQLVEKLEDVLKIVDLPVKISSLSRPPLRRALPVPQLAEQLVDVPVPEAVILARGRSAAGVIWYWEGGATGGWVALATPGGVHRQPRAVYKYWAGLRRWRRGLWLWTSL